MLRIATLLTLFIALPAVAQDKTSAKKPDGNRLAYLDEVNPYYPHKDFARLITPQWVGDKEVEAVVILAIDDMKEPRRYETYLRPILNRLKKIDGRAPVNIMTCAVDPKDPQLQAWLKEGLSIECHTFDHPCPFFKDGFDKAKATYDKCVDLMHAIPGNKPVAFRMPCCDSMNTPSPRFYAEIFNKVTDKKNFLAIDSSVFNVFTSADPELPKELVLDDKGQERFKAYLPADRSFVNTIENYPYPYVIGRLCWQFPCMTPSDWQAQHRHKPNNPKTVEDWKAALDCTVIKKGVFCLVFHPHGWIKAEQVVELIDHAVAKHGKKVKFLTFKEAMMRLNRNLLTGESIRAHSGFDFSFYDENEDGLIDAVIHMGQKHRTIVSRKIGGLGDVHEGKVTIRPAAFPGFSADDILRTLPLRFKDQRKPILGTCTKDRQAIFLNDRIEEEHYVAMKFSFPDGALLCDKEGRDAGLRLLDLDEDGNEDIVFSNEKEYGIYLFTDMEKGWSKKVMAGKRGDADALPMISRNGADNGFWVHSGHLWWSNEDTARMRDFVDRRKIRELLKAAGR